MAVERYIQSGFGNIQGDKNIRRVRLQLRYDPLGLKSNVWKLKYEKAEKVKTL